MCCVTSVILMTTGMTRVPELAHFAIEYKWWDHNVFKSSVTCVRTFSNQTSLSLVNCKCSSAFSLLCPSSSLWAIHAPHPNFMYLQLTISSEHAFLCLSRSSRSRFSMPQWLGQSTGAFRQISLWSCDINLCDPFTWQYRHSTTQRGQSVWAWLVRCSNRSNHESLY